jgi:NitT/TauT family transport system substrate-binding protein
MIGRFARLIFCLAALASALALPRVPALADDPLIVVGGSNPTGFFEVLDHVAERAGFFRDEHLAVEKQYAGNPSACAQLVATGKGDICSMGFEPVLQGYERGLRLQVFLSRDPRFEHVLGVLDDSPIRTLGDFKGKTLGEISAGSAAELGAVSTLEGAGLKRSDFSFLPIGFGAAAIAAIASHKVDAEAFPFPELASYEIVGHLKFRYFWNPILKDIGDVGYAATPAVIAAKGDQLQRFARAIVKASILVRVNPQLAARYFLDGAKIKPTDEALQNEARLLELSQDQLPGAVPTSTRIGAIPPLGLEVYTSFLAANNLTSVKVPVRDVMTDRFIGFANDFDHRAFIAYARGLR